MAAIDWEQYETAYGSAAPIEKLVNDLLDPRPKRAKSAAGDLDMAICHQHVQLHSAALPAFPFLREAALRADVEVVREVMCAIRGIAACVRRGAENHAAQAPEWLPLLRKEMVASRELWETLAKHPDTEVAAYARRITEALYGDEVPELGFD